MTVDIRAKVICRIGDEEPEIISGGWSDDHAQGTGLIRTRGELVVRGLYRFTLGQQVEIAYIQNDLASRIPRSLRVLGAFADPFRRQTTIQLGCAITLRENLKGTKPEDKTADTWDDPANDAIACSAFLDGTISISAAYVASVCAAKLNINHTGFGFLTNWFTVEQFDLTPGYATVLSDLLVSESYIGFLDASETLQVRSLLDFTGTYTVIDQGQVIDVNSINSGDIPGDAISVQYNYNRYKKIEELTEEERELRNWEKDETIGPAESHVIQYGDPNDRKLSAGIYSNTFIPKTTAVSMYDKFNRVIKRIETTEKHVCVTNPDYLKSHLERRESNILDTVDSTITETVNIYLHQADELVEPPEPPPAGGCTIVYGSKTVFDPERDSAVLRRVVTTYESEMAVAGRLNISRYSGVVRFGGGGATNWRYDPSLEPNIPVDVVNTSYEQDPTTGITKTVSVRQQALALTQAGQQVAAAQLLIAVQIGEPGSIVSTSTELVNIGTTVEIRDDRRYGLERRPSRTERNNSVTRKSAVKAVSETTFINGNELSENVTVYSVPYSPDDRVSYDGSSYTTAATDAENKARNFGRAQNRLAFGHRNGFSLQLAAPVIPPYPLDRISINGSGNSAAYICNGTSWSFDSNGIVCNTDALFIGGIGETEVGGSLWFPVQPGITLLGPAPAVYQNENPEPANSYSIDESFDPLDPPPTFWDDDLPTDTPAVPAKETEITELVPPSVERQKFVFPVLTTINVTRTDPRIPTLQVVALVAKTKISAKAVPVRYVSLPVRTELSVIEAAPAVRADPVEMFNLMSMSSTIL